MAEEVCRKRLYTVPVNRCAEEGAGGVGGKRKYTREADVMVGGGGGGAVIGVKLSRGITGTVMV